MGFFSRNSAFRFSIPLLAVALVASAALASQLRLGRPYVDETNGFAFQPPDGWDQIPTKFREVSILAKWSGKTMRGNVEPICEVMRFLKERPVDTPDASKGKGIPGAGSLYRDQPKSVFAAAEAYLYGGFDILEDDPALHSRKEVKIHYRVYKEKLRLPAGKLNSSQKRMFEKRQRVIVAASIDRADGISDCTFGVIFGCSAADVDKMLPTFKLEVERFRILDPGKEDTGTADDGGKKPGDDVFVDSEKQPAAWRELRRKKVIPGWAALDTKHYLLIYNKEVQLDLVRKIARQIEAIRKQVYEKLFPPAHEIKAISVVRVCKDRAEYLSYGAPAGSAGYWSRQDEELVFYQDRSNKRDSLRVLYHEAFHQYIHYAIGDVAPHSWFNEGHGDYFAGFNYKNGRFVPDVFRWRTGTIANAIAQHTYVPFKQFLKYTQAQYYARPDLCYSEGWALVYFLREVERRHLTHYKKYWGILDKYFDAVKKNVAAYKAEGGHPGDQVFFPTPPKNGDSSAAGDSAPKLPPIPGLAGKFPGEHPLAGEGPEQKPDTPATVAVNGPPSETHTTADRVRHFHSMKEALDAAVDEAFKGIDLDQMEKDWIRFMK